MGEPEIKQVRKYTYKDYLTWPEDERWEIIEGVAYPMIFDISPSPSLNHQRISGALFNKFYNYLENKSCEVFSAPVDVVFLNENDENVEYVETVVQPDIVVICDKSKMNKQSCKGSPDLIIEISSPSTAQRDLKEKYSLYERSGVKEYWMVHPIDRTVMIFKLGENNEYGKVERYSAEDSIKVGIFDDLMIDLKAVFKEE